VLDSVLIESQNPPRTAALKPLWSSLNNAGRNQIIALTIFVVLFKGRHLHSLCKCHDISMFVDCGVRVRQAKQLAKQSIEVGL